MDDFYHPGLCHPTPLSCWPPPCCSAAVLCPRKNFLCRSHDSGVLLSSCQPLLKKSKARSGLQKGLEHNRALGMALATSQSWQSIAIPTCAQCTPPLLTCPSHHLTSEAQCLQQADCQAPLAEAWSVLALALPFSSAHIRSQLNGKGHGKHNNSLIHVKQRESYGKIQFLRLKAYIRYFFQVTNF